MTTMKERRVGSTIGTTGEGKERKLHMKRKRVVAGITGALEMMMPPMRLSLLLRTGQWCQTKSNSPLKLPMM